MSWQDLWRRCTSFRPPLVPGVQSPSPNRRARSERRDKVFACVREVMIARGVLSSEYKFKTLSMGDGARFMVFVDLRTSRMDFAGVADLCAVEDAIQQKSLRVYGVPVIAVFWRALPVSEFDTVVMTPSDDRPAIDDEDDGQGLSGTQYARL